MIYQDFPPKVASAIAEMVVARPEIGSLIVDVMCLSDLETMSKKVKSTLPDSALVMLV